MLNLLDCDNVFSKRIKRKSKVGISLALWGLFLATTICVTSLSAAAVNDDTYSIAKLAPQELAELDITDLMNIEVTSASKTPEKLLDTPAAVYVITAEDIRRFGYRTLEDALNRIAGIFTYTNRMYGFVGVRGYAMPGDYNTRILILVDGHRINDMLFQYGSIEEDFPVDMLSVERIEFAKGPGSALWGANALLGVINVITKKGRDIDGTYIIGENGSRDRKKEVIQYGLQTPGGLDVAASGSYVGSDGQRRIFFRQWENVKQRFWGRSIDSDGQRAAKGYLSLGYKDLRFMYVDGTRTKKNPYGEWKSMNKPENYIEDRRMFMELDYDKDVSKAHNGKLSFRLYHDYYMIKESKLFNLGSLVKPNYLRSITETGLQDRGAEARYSLDLSSRISAVAGFEYFSLYDLLSYDDAYQYQINSYYLQTSAQLLDSLRLVSGIRLDKYSTFGKAWSPRAALIWNASKTSSLKLLYGTAFRAPHLFEISQNPGVNPETINTTELVWDQQLNTRGRLTISLYDYKMEDLIDGLTFENTGRIGSRGTDVQLDWRLSNGMIGYLGLSAGKASNLVTHEYLDNSPRYQSSFGVSFPLWKQKIFVSPEFNYVGPRKEGASTISHYGVVNLKITANITDRFDMSFGSYNMLDKIYFGPGLAPQPKRTTMYQMNYRF
ncbi:MAG: TonB-dependent receptor [Armatimonadota bacterium]|nr:TonB-dependent receptor [Armatimonadota bacterium]